MSEGVACTLVVLFAILAAGFLVHGIISVLFSVCRPFEEWRRKSIQEMEDYQGDTDYMDEYVNYYNE